MSKSFQLEIINVYLQAEKTAKNFKSNINLQKQMQSKGFIRVIAVLLVLVCLFYLSFSFVTNSVENEAADKAAQLARTEALKKSKDVNSEIYKAAYDSVYNKAYAKNLKDVGQEEVYLWYTYNQVREKQIGLGLDLKGGMTVTLQINVADIVRAKATNPLDAKLNEALEYASKNPGNDFVGAFAKKYEELVPGVRLSQKFNTVEGVNANDDNAKVEGVLREKARTDISRSVNLLRERIDRFGVIAPNIKEMQREGQILMELPGVKEPERVYKLIQTSARLEFYATYTVDKVQGAFLQLSEDVAAGNAHVAEVATEVATEVAEGEDVAANNEAVGTAAVEAAPAVAPAKPAEGEKTLAQLLWSQDKMVVTVTENKKTVEKEVPVTAYVGGACVAVVNELDTAAVNTILRSPAAKRILPNDLKCAWSVKGVDKKGTYFQLVALKTVNGEAALGDEDMIDDASAELQQFSGSYEVNMTMNSDAAAKWAKVTRENVGNQVAIVLDDQVYSFPTVNTAIEGGRSSITGNFTVDEANDLVNVLTGGGMSASVDIVSHTEIGPSLGQEAIEAGIWSFVIALILLMLFMIAFYGFTPAMIANMCLILNLFFTLGILASFQAVLTLPGICGIVLSLGMAVDANVLIFERTKEELRAGKNLKAALADGYKNAFSAIFDSNLTSVITAIILMSYGTGLIKGFATTLLISIICSFFTAVFVSRLVFEALLKKERNYTFTTALSRNLLANTKVDFLGQRKKALFVVVALVVVIVASFFMRGINKGIDFSGGRNYIVQFDHSVKTDDIQSKLQPLFGDASVSVITVDNDTKVRVSTNYKINEQNDGIDNEIMGKLYEGLKDEFKGMSQEDFSVKNEKVGVVSTEMVGPSIADDMTRGAIWSVILSLIAIALYILIRFRDIAFSVGALASLAFTSFIIIGFYSLFWGILPFSMEIDQQFIAAILTIIGYAINDTVVVFDRVRETIGLYPKQPRYDVINRSLNSTLTRTIMTSCTTVLVLLVIFLLGGETIRGFVFAMLFGVIIGTLSTIYVATPVAYSMMRKKEAKKAAK